MQIYNKIKSNLVTDGSAVALGVFDGVHLGHVKIIKNSVDFAKHNQLKSAVATFSNHPQSELTGQIPHLLTTFEERMGLIEKLGVDIVLAPEFDSKLRHMSAQDYFTKVLIDSLDAKYISIGYDHKFGFNQEGNPDKLKEWGKKLGIKVKVNTPVNINEEPVSSTRIRKNLMAGNIKTANILLGRYYSVNGHVTQGIKRGTELGFPTANLMISNHLIIPGIGVYVGLLSIKDLNKNKLPCVVNVGHCPTFKDETSELKVEAHILDFPYQELYKQEIKLEFIDRLRNEEKFNSREGLIKQIKKDCEEARKILAAA